jgi:hypothetical protein
LIRPSRVEKLADWRPWGGLDVDAALIGAIAALLTAAAGLATILFPKETPKETGKPWLFGVGILAIVGIVLLLVALVGPKPRPNDTPSGGTPDVYQGQVIAICDEDRENELRFKHQMEQIQKDAQGGDFSTLSSVASLMTNGVIKEQGLADRLEALHPPSELEASQSEAVAMWRRKIAASREVRDQLVKAGGDPMALAQAMQGLDYTEESRLESEKDVRLRKLGGSGCKPSP